MKAMRSDSKPGEEGVRSSWGVRRSGDCYTFIEQTLNNQRQHEK